MYPMTIPASEEEKVRAAAKEFDGVVLELQQQYAIQDKQDLLAMAGLHLATRLRAVESDTEKDEVDSTLNSLITKVKGSLTEEL